MDSVIHNAGVGFKEPYQETEDALPHVFQINSLAPYILTCLINKPKRLIYTSSGLHQQGDTKLEDLLWKKRNGMIHRHIPTPNCRIFYWLLQFPNVGLTYFATWYPQDGCH